MTYAIPPLTTKDALLEIIASIPSGVRRPRHHWLLLLHELIVSWSCHPDVVNTLRKKIRSLPWSFLGRPEGLPTDRHESFNPFAMAGWALEPASHDRFFV